MNFLKTAHYDSFTVEIAIKIVRYFECLWTPCMFFLNCYLLCPKIKLFWTPVSLKLQNGVDLFMLLCFRKASLTFYCSPVSLWRLVWPRYWITVFQSQQNTDSSLPSEIIFKYHVLASRTSKDLNFLSYLPSSFLPSPLRQNLDKSQNFDNQINQFPIQITFCYQLIFRM